MNSLNEIISYYKQHANPEIAKEQAAYMKNHFRFLGIKKPLQTQLNKKIFSHLKVNDENELTKLIEQLWKQPEREFTYLACTLAEKYDAIQSPLFLDTLERMIREKSWWDTVDWIAARMVGTLVTRYPQLELVMHMWINDENMWIRRTALLYQLKYKEKTNAEKLFSFCTARKDETEFFIRKAIGWVLREYSKTNRDAVAEFIEEHKDELSPLSVREGSKYL